MPLLSLPTGTGAGMCTFHMRHLAIAAGVALLSLCNQPVALARGAPIGRDDPWNSERIERLPPEVRNAVIRMCGDHPPRAGHYFATFFENSRLIRLHFELLQCDGSAMFCRGDSCLRQEYGLTGGHYRLMKTYYGNGTN
jgi:hypothetical protein